MRRLAVFVFVVVIAVAAAYMAAHRMGPAADRDSPGAIRHARAPRQDGQSDQVQKNGQAEAGAPNSDPVAGALAALFEKANGQESAIPKGVKVLSVNVDRGIATIDLSREFNELKQHGSTTESNAQASLRRTLAQFPTVQKMLVLVEGKPFEGEHSEWNEAISVREENAGAGQ